MRLLIALAALAAIVALPAAAAPHGHSAKVGSPVLMISIDGLRPLDVIEADQRGFTAPNLRKLMSEGVYSTGVRNSLPTVTYPNHTTMITGVWPAKHGIANNSTFDPTGDNMGGWYWYASDIKVPTLWDAVHGAGGKVASLSWPVSVGSPSIDYDIPEYWRAKTAEDIKLVKALITPGLIAPLEARTGLTYAQAFGDDPKSDDAPRRLRRRPDRDQTSEIPHPAPRQPGRDRASVWPRHSAGAEDPRFHRRGGRTAPRQCTQGRARSRGGGRLRPRLRQGGAFG